jgi:hypothetical protein
VPASFRFAGKIGLLSAELADMETLSLLEFAVACNKSERSIRRYLEQGKLTTVDTPDGPRIPSEQLYQCKPVGTLPAHLPATPAVDTNAGKIVGRSAGSARLLAQTIEHRLLDQVEALRIELDTEREEKHRERRLADQLRAEIGGYQRALSETAESLSEQRAQVEAYRLVEAQRQAEVANQVERMAELENLRVDATTNSRGWGSRLRRIFGVRQTG